MHSALLDLQGKIGYHHISHVMAGTFGGNKFALVFEKVLVAQLDRASASEAEGYWFESSRG